MEKVRDYHTGAAYRKASSKRQVWVEPLFGEAKHWHGLRQFRLRGLLKVIDEALITASGQNPKHLLAAKPTKKVSDLGNLMQILTARLYWKA